MTITQAQLNSLRTYFNTTKLKTKKRKTLRVESDGCAGNEITHCRLLYLGKSKTCIGTLEGDDDRIGVTVHLAKRGAFTFWKPYTTHEFKNLKTAAAFLQEKL